LPAEAWLNVAAVLTGFAYHIQVFSQGKSVKGNALLNGELTTLVLSEALSWRKLA
jgi:hypothetical protein